MAMAHSYEAGESKEKEKEGKGRGMRSPVNGASTADNKWHWAVVLATMRRHDRRFLPGLSSPASLPRPVLPPSAIRSLTLRASSIFSFLFFPFLSFLRP